MRSFEGNNKKPQSAAQRGSLQGNDPEAFDGRNQTPTENGIEVRALTLLLELYERKEKWEKAAKTAETLCNLEPGKIGWWMLRAMNVGRKPGGDAFATREVLYAALQRFPGNPIILYNLACCSNQMGDYTAAWSFLAKTYGTTDREEIRRQAGDEPQLESLWKK